MKIVLQDVRLAFPALFEPKSVAGDKKLRYGGNLIFSPDHAGFAAMNKAIEQVATEKWGAKAKAMLTKLRAASDKLCFRNGDTKADYDGYPGNWFVSANRDENKGPPLVLGRDRQPLLAGSGKPYAGCYVNASIDVWAQDNSFGQRVNATLLGVQFFRDGDAFSAGAPADPDDFDDISGSDDDDPMGDDGDPSSVI